MITTSLGGHLCWFEIGGSRWFNKPVRYPYLGQSIPKTNEACQIANFLNHLAFQTDLDRLTPQQEPKTNGIALDGHDYKPMRRKLLIVDE